MCCLADAVLLNNIVQNFGMLDLVKKVLASHKCQMDRSREQYARDLAGARGAQWLFRHRGRGVGRAALARCSPSWSPRRSQAGAGGGCSCVTSAAAWSQLVGGCCVGQLTWQPQLTAAW